MHRLKRVAALLRFRLSSTVSGGAGGFYFLAIMNVLQQINRAQRREANKGLLVESLRQPSALCEVPAAQWPERRPAGLSRVWRSRGFLVQEYTEKAGAVRLSVNRAAVGAGGHWEQDITWEELQQLKAECGYADRWAVEVYPPAAAVVNVANMRHLWLIAEAPAYAWGANKEDITNG